MNFSGTVIVASLMILICFDIGIDCHIREVVFAGMYSLGEISGTSESRRLLFTSMV